MTDIINWFVEPLSFPFMQYALLTALIVSVVCGILSCYLVLKGWSLMGDAISHAVLPGIIVAFVTGIPLVAGAFVSGLACAVGVGYLKNNSRLKEDTVMGIVFSGMFAFGLVLFTKVETDQHLTHILFGNILGVSYEELLRTLLICGVVFTVVMLKKKDLMLYCFDPVQAGVAGLSPRMLHYGLLILLALTIISAIQVAGVVLVIAMLISPGITASLLTHRFDRMMVIVVVCSVITGLAGTILSYHLDAATGPTIILLQAVLFVCALGYSKLKERF
ncbi:metal ABC transporter permease [Neisseria canis]|uniref:Membrane protein n=1 Tax=Neisseria canis TaxID=493 RepID=A0A1X3CXL5_9NEIS|nr:metal ABC transporter permease [Neisseria canis]OSI12242.1 iron ABC transporter permease [Neisseria canis]VEF03659.1 membrane protein [Neisseria canis]